MNELIERVRTEGNPLVDGGTAIFIWQGAEPPLIVGDHNYWSAIEEPPWEQVTANIWSCKLIFPEDASITYNFQDEDGAFLPDPLNNNRKTDYDSYYFDMSPTANNLQIRQEHVPKGTVIELNVETMIGVDRLAAGETRKLSLYQPPVAVPVPLVVVYDGIEYQKVAHLPEIVDNLIHQERMQPIALAMIESVEESRPVEYTCSDATVGFIVEAVIPPAIQYLNLVDATRHPGAYGIIGASAGGSMALFTALRAPEIFGKVLSQSGFFFYPTFGELTAAIYPNMLESVIVQLIKNIPVYPLQIWMDVGIYDLEMLLEPNERMFALLKNRGYDVTLRRFSGGHSWYPWRQDLPFGLQRLFPFAGKAS